MRVVFMGTPDFAVGTLKAIIEAGHDVAAVVTQQFRNKMDEESLFSLQLRRKLWRMESQCYSRREQEMKHL